jgi:serine/threonine-protein kinase
MSHDQSGTAHARAASSSRLPTSSRNGHSQVLVGSSGLSYTPLRKLGEGGMAEILLAYAEGTGGFSKLVVLKMMRRYLDGGSDYRSMFLEEARVSARLNHPNLVQVHEVVDAGDAPFMVMEYLEGKPLSRLRGLTAMPREMLLTIVCEALVGLHHAHESVDFDGSPLHIVHRDVSPHNIFVTYDGVAKILDFGIAKAGTAASQTKTGEIKGKLAYMPPEQLLGEDLDRRADVFAMGAVLWELMLDTPLWAGLDQGTVMHRLASGEIPRPTAKNGLDAELEAILIRATAADRDNRYQTAIEMHQELSTYREQLKRVYTPREVGDALSTVFQADRLAERESTRQALKAPSLPPNAPSLIPDAEPFEPDGFTPPSRGKTALVWLTVLGAIGLAVFLASRYIVAPSAPAARETAAATAASARLVFRVKPAEASIEIDGTVRGSGDLELALPADALQHRVVVSAKGHTPTSRLVRFQGVQYLDFQLAPAPAPSSPTGEAAAEDDARGSKSDDKKAPRRGRAISHAPAAPVPAAPSAAPADATQARPDANCSPPYFFKDGVKTYRPECL